MNFQLEGVLHNYAQFLSGGDGGCRPVREHLGPRVLQQPALHDCRGASGALALGHWPCTPILHSSAIGILVQKHCCRAGPRPAVKGGRGGWGLMSFPSCTRHPHEVLHGGTQCGIVELLGTVAIRT